MYFGSLLNQPLLPDRDGLTILHTAAFEGALDAVHYLCAFGADINERTPNKETPLHLAAKQGNVAVVKYLIQRGANISLKNGEGKTIRQIAKTQLDSYKGQMSGFVDPRHKYEDIINYLDIVERKKSLQLPLLCQEVRIASEITSYFRNSL